MIDLKPFCGDYAGTRDYLKNPFSRGEWTYATNGHICVRVPRIADFAEADKPNAERIFSDHPASSSYVPLPQINVPTIPQPVEADCDECGGSGHEHECPDCKCDCLGCGGSGTDVVEKTVSVPLGAAYYSAKYIKLIQSLPNVEIGDTHPENPMRFRFDGGEGLVMPVRHKPEDRAAP